MNRFHFTVKHIKIEGLPTSSKGCSGCGSLGHVPNPRERELFGCIHNSIEQS